MSLGLVLAAVLVSVEAPADDVVVSDLAVAAVQPTADFAIGTSPYALGGTYLEAQSRPACSPPGKIRVAAPEGAYYVYLAWVRHPRGARDVAVRVGDVEVAVDQTRLANGLSPDDCPRDDMGRYEGLCSSGLFRVTDRPIRLRPGDMVEITRSDTQADTVTTLDYVVFSPSLYLDDLGSDAAAAGPPSINLKDYGRSFSGDVGFGLAFIAPEQEDAALEWTVPAEGPFIVSALPNRGRSRAEVIPIEIELDDGRWVTCELAGKSRGYGRAEWQHLGVLRAARGAKLRLRAAKDADGVSCCDLLRLAPVSEADLTRRDQAQYETFTVQWEDPTDERPWLKSVRIASTEEGDVRVEAPRPKPGMPGGACVHVARKILPLLGSDGATGLPLEASGSFRVELGDDYGFTLSAAQLRREPFVWLRGLGVFACADGDFASKQAEIAARAAQVEAARKEPFRSTSEQYFELTGYDETRDRLEDRAFEFAYRTPRGPAPRVSESLASMPEVDFRYFCDRIPDVKHRRMFLGWPNVCQEFYVLSNGCIGVSSGSGHGTGHPAAEHFTVSLGLGDTPTFREHGDPSVTQSIEDGYHIIVHTEWHEGETGARATALAYPLDGEEVRTGNEPLGAFVRFERTSGDAPLWLAIAPDYWRGPKQPLQDLAKARIEGGLLLVGDRVVLAVDHATASVESAADERVLVKIVPDDQRADLVIPYVAVERPLVERAVKRGFEAALLRTKQYWDERLARGATIDVPDPVVVNQYKTLYPRTLVTGDLDTQGDYALKTSPIVYDRVWLHATAYGIEGLSRRGHFEEARQYLEAGFRWQGSQASEASEAYTTWDGFFTAPERYTAVLWLNYHGWFQWAAARHFLFSDDRPWLDEKLPALIKSLEWTVSQRKLTMREEPGGSRPINHGWLPPGRVTDGSGGTSTFTDCINWMGFNEVVNVLERIDHPRAAEFRRAADDYRRCVLRGLRLAARRREPVRLNDGVFVPYVPGYLESDGREETMWYAAVVDGAQEGILDSGIVPPGDPMESWVLGNLEDNLFVMAPNLADEGHFLGHACAYLRRDQPEHAIYTLYSTLATQSARQTLTTYEHRSWGARRVYDLAPWPMGYYTRLLTGMLCYDEGDELVYCRATPRAWLEPGGEIRVERLQTRFGPTSFRLEAEQDRVTGLIELPTRYRPRATKLRIRTRGKLTSVRLNGEPAPLDEATGTVTLPSDAARVRVEAVVRRGQGLAEK
ncbi:MAG TPA: hypothetical protein VMY37_02200 [Thermoguttaceae bacterium]|nr:hypothetical protein [Thermoguttaceae bacterium]